MVDDTDRNACMHSWKDYTYCQATKHAPMFVKNSSQSDISRTLSLARARAVDASQRFHYFREFSRTRTLTRITEQWNVTLSSHDAYNIYLWWEVDEIRIKIVHKEYITFQLKKCLTINQLCHRLLIKRFVKITHRLTNLKQKSHTIIYELKKCI